jgi:hypothetical protein
LSRTENINGVRFRWNGAQAFNRVAGILYANMFRVAQRVLRTAQEKIRGGDSTGRIYWRGQVWHQASAPGEPPASDRGRLRQSGDIRIEYRGGKVIGYVVFHTPYAQRLEFGFIGTDSRGRVYNQAPRPFVRPSINEDRRQLIRMLKRGLGR